MPAQFGRAKVWNAKEVLVYSDLNNEFSNILNNLDAIGAGGYSTTPTQMRSQVNPGTVGSESLATSLSGELERIRFAISRIIGKTYWYEAPLYDLSTLGTSFKSTCGFFLSEDSKKDAIFKFHKYFSEEVVTNGITKGNAKFSTYGLSNSTVIASYYPTKQNIINPDQNTISCWIKNIATGDGIVCNPLLGIYAYLNVSGQVQVDIETGEFDAIGGGKVVRSVVGTASAANLNEFKNFILRTAVSGALGAGNDKLNVYFDGVQQGTPYSGSITSNFGSSSGSWYFFGKKNPALTLQKKSSFGVAPDLEAANPWVLTQTGGSHSVSNGILTINSTAGTTRYFTMAAGVTPASAPSGIILRTKLRMTDSGVTTYTGANGIFSSAVYDGFEIGARIDTGDLNFRAFIGRSGISVCTYNLAINNNFPTATHDFTQWTELEISMIPTSSFAYYNSSGLQTSTNSTTLLEIKINGESRIKVNLFNDTTAGSFVYFGKQTTASVLSGFSAELEYFECYTGGTNFIVPNNSLTQAVSDIAVFNQYITSDPLVSTLSTTDPNVICPIGDIEERQINQIQEYLPVVGPYGATNVFDLSVSNATGQEWINWLDITKPLVKFSSDGVTPTKILINGTITLSTASSAVSPSMRGTVGFRPVISKNYYTEPNVGSQTLGIAANELAAFAGSQFPASAVNVSLYPFAINDVRVWPAGEISLMPVISLRKLAGSAATLAEMRTLINRVSVT